ncbi:MAG TPA: hypothetical protein VFP80_16140 [Thermoanaerobaculia bacterium]|nr:hypothetical protein [Thermoanaerobaculia bacterium]
MAQVLVRDLEDETVDKLKARAATNNRSLQAELQLILERAAETDVIDGRAVAARIRRMLSGRKLSDSAALIAEDRRR